MMAQAVMSRRHSPRIPSWRLTKWGIDQHHPHAGQHMLVDSSYVCIHNRGSHARPSSVAQQLQPCALGCWIAGDGAAALPLRNKVPTWLCACRSVERGSFAEGLKFRHPTVVAKPEPDIIPAQYPPSRALNFERCGPRSQLHAKAGKEGVINQAWLTTMITLCRLKAHTDNVEARG